MGRFIDHEDKKIVNQYIESYMESIIDYSKFQRGTPTYVTYYSIDFHSSTADRGLGEVLENIGSESPLKFNKILNFPLFATEEMIPELNYDEELGLDTDLNSTALILPDTIEPQIGDYFLISYEEINKLYKINDVSVTAHSDKIFYKITFASVSSNLDILEERQIQDIYEVVFENIGTEKNSVILKKDYLLLNNLRQLYDKLADRYKYLFYNKTLNQFILIKENSSNLERLYDNNLSIFINKNKFFIAEKTLLENIIIEPCYKKFNDYLDYEYSLFFSIEEKNKEIYKNKSLGEATITDSIFSLYPEIYKKIIYYSINETDLNSENIWLNDILDYSNSNLNNILNKTEFEYKDVINLYMFEFDNSRVTYDFFIKMILTLKNNRNYKTYTLLPIILYILLKIEDKIFTR